MICRGGRGKTGRIAASAVSLVLNLAFASSAKAVVDTTPSETTAIANTANDIAGAIANFYGAGQAITAAMQLFGWITGPTPPVTFDQIKAEMLKIAAYQDWKINQAELDHIRSAMDSMRDAGNACQPNNTCDIRILGNEALAGPSDDARTWLLDLTSSDMLYWTRFKSTDLSIPWTGLYAPSLGLNHPPVVAPQADANNYVYDWRGTLPYYLTYLSQRLAFLGFADSLFPGGSQIEIQDHINNLWAHYNKMRDGIQCGTGEEAQPGSGDATCYPYYYPTEYCIDIYSGTYASRYLGPSQCPMYFPTSAEIASIPSVDAQLKRQVFDTLPLKQMAHLVSILNLYLNPHQHGFLIEADGGEEPLYLNAWGGASEGDVVRLHRDCMTSNTDCTWRYENGMLASDTDPTLKLQASSAYGPLILTRSCTSDTASCLWTYDHGQWKNNNNGLMQTLDGLAHGTRVGVAVLASLAGTVSQTWTMPNVMFNPTQFGTSAAMRAWGQSLDSSPWGTGDAAEQGPVEDYSTSNSVSSACLPNNPDCTWTITNNGMVLSDQNPSLGLNAWGGGTADNPPLVVTSECLSYNPDCTWKLSSSGISIDNGGKLITYEAFGGSASETLSLQAPCTGPYCFFSSTTFSIVQAAD